MCSTIEWLRAKMLAAGSCEIERGAQEVLWLCKSAPNNSLSDVWQTRFTAVSVTVNISKFHVNFGCLQSADSS